MLSRVDHDRLLRYAGLFTWAVIGLPLLLLSLPGGGTGDALAQSAVGWRAWLAWGLFGASYWWLTRALGGRRVGPLDHALLAVLAGSAIAISYYSQSGLGSILLLVFACVLPWLLPVGLGVAVLVLCEFVIVPVYVRGLGFSWAEAVLQASLYVGFTGFAFVTSLVARQQSEARDEQGRLNAELRATRALLAESVRVNERTRISRELHDLLGHHLTALSLNLEVAGHLARGPAQEHVAQAHTLARLLLSDVREAVGQMRGNDAIDMAATLLPLGENVPGLRIEMELPRPFLMNDPERAHVLLRCTQEIITNAVRHAQAQRLRLHYAAERGAIRLVATDDGRGVAGVVPGNGLRGMRERLSACGGEVEFDTGEGRGFTLRIRLPIGEGPTAAVLAGPADAVAVDAGDAADARVPPPAADSGKMRAPERTPT